MANGLILITHPITFHRRRATSRRVRSPPASRSGRVSPLGTPSGACDWSRGNINVANRNVNINNFNRNNINNFNKWEHNADHCHGVKYNNADVRQKFAKTDVQAGKAARQDFRGKDGQKVWIPAAPARAIVRAQVIVLE